MWNFQSTMCAYNLAKKKLLHLQKPKPSWSRRKSMKIKDSSLLDKIEGQALEVRKIPTLNLANPLQKKKFG